jgi:hypothetical protein
MYAAKMLRGSSQEYAAILAKCMPIEHVADLLNNLLCVEADPRFTDREATLGRCLFNRLSEVVPEAEELAHSR